MGDGYVVVQPSELLPPQTGPQSGLMGQFRQQEGTPGLNQRGAWG